MPAGGARANGLPLIGKQKKSASSANQAIGVKVGTDILAAGAGSATEPLQQAMQQSRSWRAGRTGAGSPAGLEVRQKEVPRAADWLADTAPNTAASIML
jgi:hypothetical protein